MKKYSNKAKLLVVGVFLLGMLMGRAYEAIQVEQEIQAIEAERDLFKAAAPSPNPVAYNWEYTGDDIWTALNEYRESVGSPALSLSETACTDIAGRWLMEHENEYYSHDGLMEFAKKQYSAGRWKRGFRPAELLAKSPTLEGTMLALKESPSHNLIMSDKDYRYGCAYSREGFTVIFLHKTINDN